MGSAIDRLQKRLYGAAPSAAPSGADRGSAIDRVQSMVYRNAPYTVQKERSYAAKAAAKEQESQKKQGDPGFFERVGSTVKGVLQRQASGYAGAAENALELTRHMDTLASTSYQRAQQERKNAAHYRDMLKRGTLDDGTVIDDAMRARLERMAELSEKRAAIGQKGTEEVHKPITGLIDKADAYGDRMSAGAAESFDRAKQGAGTAGRIAVDLAGALGDVATDAGANLLLPGLGTAARVARTYGHGAEAAEDKDLGIGRQALYGAGSAALGEGINRLFGGNPILEKATGKGALDDLLLPNLGKTLPGRMVKSGLGEAIEEGAESIADPFLQQAALGKEQADPLDWKEVGYDALIGGLVGGLTGISKPKSVQEAPAQTAGTEQDGGGGVDTPAVQDGAQGAFEPVRVGRVTTIKNPYQGVKPVQTQKNTAAIPVDSGSVERAQNRINGARGLEGAMPGKSFKATLKDAYKSVFKAANGVPVTGVTFNGKPYTVDIPNSVPGKVISDHNLTAEKLALLDILPQVVQSGEFVGSGDYIQHGSKKKLTIRFDYFETPVEINGKSYVVSFDVEAFPDKNNYRTHKLHKIELSPIADADTGRDPAASATETAPVEGTRPLNVDSTIPQSAEPVNSMDPLLKLILGGQRVDQSKASNEQFGALAERGDVGVDAAGKLYQINPEDHIDRRSMDSVAGRSLNAFQFDHPELHGYYRKAAEALIADADLSLQFPMTRSYARGMQGSEVHQKVQASAHLRRAMDETGLTRAQLIDAAERIIHDKGQENVKAAKQVELILDHMLSDGWITMAGDVVFADRGYLAAKEAIAGSLPLEDDGDLPDGLDALPSEADGGMMGETVLTEDETAALLAYKSSESYKINTKLRDGLELDEAESRMVANLDSALVKLPKVKGTVYRTLNFDDVFNPLEEYEAFMTQHTVGGFVTYDAYTSTSKKVDGYPLVGEARYGVTMEIASRNARNLAGFGNNFESEALFPRGTDFVILSVSTGQNGHTHIVMEEAEANAERNEPDHDTQKRSVAVRGVQEAHPVHGDVRGVPGRDSEGDQVRKSNLQGARKSRPEVSTGGEIDQRGSGGSEDAGRGMPRGAETGNPVEERSQAMQQMHEASEAHDDLPAVSTVDSGRGPDWRGLPGVRGEEVTDGLGAADAGFDPYSRLQNQTDRFYPEGPDAARPVDVPMEDSDGRKIPKSASTVMGAQGTGEDAVRMLERQIVSGELSFDTIHDTDAVGRAQRTVSDKGFGGALEQYRQAVSAGVATKDNTTLGQQLLLQAMREGNTEATAELLTLYTRNSTTAAQAMQAQSIFRKLSPEGQLTAIQKAVSELNEKHGTDVELEPEDVADFLNAETDEARREVTERMVQKAAQQVPGTFRAKFDTLRYLSMLGNPRTHIRNILGNTFFQIPVAVKNRVGAAAEGIAYKVSGGKTERTKSLFGVNPFGKLAAEARADWANVKDFLGESSKYQEGQISLWDIEQKADAFSGSNPFGRGINRAADFNSRALAAEDTAAKKWIYTQSLAGYLKANGFRGMADAAPALLNRARDYAAQEALRNTFNDKNAFSDAVSKLGGMTRSDNPFVRGAGYITEGVLPFKRTPANIAVRAVEYSPVGAVLGAVETVRGAKAGDLARVASGLDRTAAGVSGTALLAAGFLAAGAGYVTGGEDEDEKQAAFDDLTGHQAYALELKNGSSVTLDWLAPEAIPFFMGVELYRQGLENGLSWEEALETVKNASAPMLEMSMLQGLNDTFENAAYAKNRGESVLGALVTSALTNYATQIFPTIGGQLERSGEDVRMTTYTDKNGMLPTDLQYTLGKVSQKIPGWDYQQIPYIDAWGREEETGDPMERAVNNLFNPAYVSQVDVDKVERELQRVKDATGDGGVFPQRAGRSITVNGEKKDLTAEEYQAYAKSLGRTRYQMLKDGTRLPVYRSMSDGEKAAYIGRLYQYADQQAKAAVSDYAPEAWVRNAKSAQRELGVSPAEYLALYEQYGSSVMSGRAYEKTKQAVQAGLTVGEYVSMKRNADKDGSGSVTKSEAMEALQGKQNRVDLWDLICTTSAKNPYA